MSVCDHCGFDLPDDWLHCPHCWHGQRPLNVLKAQGDPETASLQERYDHAIDSARNRKCETQVRQFETEIESAARIVMGSTVNKLMPIVRGAQDIFATYHDLAELRFRQEAKGPIDWNTKRPQAEIELLGTHKHIDKLHYAVLSLDGSSLPHYGECTILLAPKLITHRASLLTENSVICFLRFGGNIPPGHRADWKNRAKLCVAKLAAKITASTQSGEFASMLLQAGASGTGIDDEFVEVQILGEMTIRTFEKISIAAGNPSGKSVSKRQRKKRGTSPPELVQDYCRQHGVPCELV